MNFTNKKYLLIKKFKNIYKTDMIMIIKKTIAIIIIALFSLTIIAASTAYAEQDFKKETCKDNGGEWEDGVCDFKTDDEDKADEFLKDSEKIEKFEDDKANLEDELCDDEDAEETNIDICQSATLAFAESDNNDN